MPRNPHISILADRMGIVFPDAVDFSDSQLGMDAAQRVNLGMDAAPPNALQAQLVTVGNAGIPAYLANYLDPQLTRVLVAPTKAALIFGEAKKGDWTTKTAVFPIIESTGDVSSYGDYNNNGLAGANANYEARQSYTYQAFTRWGDMELEMAGLAKIDWAAEQNMACAINFKKFQNKSYFFGISGLDNFGWLNDPSLNAPIAPASSVWTGNTGVEIFADIQSLFGQLQKQLNGNVELDSPMVLAMSPLRAVMLITPMSLVYGTATVEDMIKKTFPNLRIMTAVEYTTDAGELIQMKVDNVDGQEVGFCGFTETMRAHAIVRDTSSTYQKKSAGTWGAIVKIPAAIAQMLGV